MTTEKDRFYSAGRRILALGDLGLKELYELVLAIGIEEEDLAKELKLALNSVSERLYGIPLTVDEKSLVPDDPDKVVARLAEEVAKSLEKEYAEKGIVTTTAQIRHMAAARARDILSLALRLVMIKYGVW